MFLSKSEMKSAIYEYQLDAITDEDDDIVEMGISAAIEEAAGYLRLNNAIVKDGRLRYDVTAVFAATGTARSPLVLQMVKSLAVWHIIQLSNPDMIYDKVKDRYDRAVSWLKGVSKGDITLSLPLLPAPAPAPTDQSLDAFRYGSRAKFNHE